jgi:hypothetical protein
LFINYDVNCDIGVLNFRIMDDNEHIQPEGNIGGESQQHHYEDKLHENILFVQEKLICWVNYVQSKGEKADPAGSWDPVGSTGSIGSNRICQDPLGSKRIQEDPYYEKSNPGSYRIL